MYLIMRHYSGPITFSHEERVGPFASLEELDDEVYPHRNSFWTDLFIEDESNIRRWYSYQDAAERATERRRHGR